MHAPGPAAEQHEGAVQGQVAGRALALACFRILSDLATFLLLVVISRVHGEHGIGYYSVAVALGGPLAVLADFGLYRLSLRELGRRDQALGEFFRGCMMLRSGLVAAGLTLTAATAALLPFPSEGRAVVALVAGHLVLYTIANGFTALFIARGAARLAALVEFVARATAAGGAAGLVALGLPLAAAVLVLPATTLLQIVISWRVAHGRYPIASGDADALPLRRLARQTGPYVLAALFRQITTRSDVVILGVLLGAGPAGLYNVAYRIVFLFIYLPVFLALSILPVAARFSEIDDRAQLCALARDALGWMILLGVPVAAGLWLIAPELVPLLFGASFRPSVDILRLLAWLYVFSCVHNLLQSLMTATGRQATLARLHGAVALAAVIGHLIAVPRFGPAGAAVVAVGAEALATTLLAIQLRHLISWRAALTRVVSATCGALAFVLPFTPLSAPLWIVVPSSAVLFVLVALAFPDIRRHEGSTLRALLGVRGRRAAPDRSVD